MQPIVYASRDLTPAETRYTKIRRELLAMVFACDHFETYIFTQIERELLTIVFACDHFETYIIGWERVNVETDHQPLEIIMRKPLNNACKRLQRMLLQLQKGGQLQEKKSMLSMRAKWSDSDCSLTYDVESLPTTTTRFVQSPFRCYGVPDTLVTDNGPQFSSAEFVTFTKVWSFEHSTRHHHIHYPQSNGKAENLSKQ